MGKQSPVGLRDILIRPARPEDAGFLGWAILAAGRAHLPRGWYDIALQLSEAECLAVLSRLVLTRTPSWWGLSNFLVAEADGSPVGALCCFDSANGWGSLQGALAEALEPLGWGEAEMAALWSRGDYVFACLLPTPDEEAWVIENVAVAADRRGRGVAGALLAAALERGRSLGFRRAQLSFVIGNDAAEQAYLKAGFELDDESRHPDFEAACGAPGLRRLARAI